MTVGRIIEGRDYPVLTCQVSTKVSEAVATLSERRIGALPVLDGDKLAGIFSERDVIYRLHEHGPGVLDKAVAEVMTAPAVTVEPGTSVLAALSLMTRRRFRHLPVMENGTMIALVSIGDLVKHRIDAIESEAEAMRSYIQTA
ncbi:hypothetical protein B2G71_13480 [Novosphingobium sp. PC22D]|uniref:CBS domain-containing protein n=1 Tax=Novosphingobium sp. PC22D TaxID=1962403 RepID=UPI000BEF5CE3|nr:CBS domain-containing protein [Novosphingobium sp. PC22D]PEQ12149.1 hypothetical protein B2G71_13480 [Novosphingobium sp. PC22D]